MARVQTFSTLIAGAVGSGRAGRISGRSEEEEEEEREIQQRMYHKTLVSLTCGADM